MKLTLLELTQNILSALSSDEVNSISDTSESLQVAECIKTTYINMLGRYDLPEHNQLFQLTPSNDDTAPVLMYRPDGITRIEWIRYFDSNPLDGSSFQQDQFGAYSHDLNLDLQNNSNNTTQTPPGYKEVKMIPIEDFIKMVNQFNTAESDVGTFNLSVLNGATGITNTFTFNYKNDVQPSYCCVLSNYYVIFDSYDNTQDSTLQASKTMAYGWVQPNFLMQDNFTPNLDDQQVALLLNDAKSLAFFELKQLPHQKAEEEVAKQLVSLQKWKAIAAKPTYFDELPDFGRSGSGFQGLYKGGVNRGGM